MRKNVLAHKPIDPAILSLVEQCDGDPEAVLEIFQERQDEAGALTREDVAEIARALQIPGQQAYGVSSFYTLLQTPRADHTVRVCDGPACWLAGANELREAIQKKHGEKWTVERASCLGLCDHAPAALVGKKQVGRLDGEAVLVSPDNWFGAAGDISKPRPGEVRVLLRDVNGSDPTSIDAARERGGYQALAMALAGGPEAVIAEVQSAGLVGHGGAGFPTGQKWQYVAQADSKCKYIVCNADESEPLAFKDRTLIETNPHQLLEGMALAAYAVGAREGFIYIRGEYAAQAVLLEDAIEQAEEHLWLGENIHGSDFSFYVHVHRGAGAYICGEETALLESLEGRRGEPRLRPPYPTTSGYKGCPTVVNNVETLSKVPSIILNGSDWYRSLTGAETPGTKLYAVLGKVNNPGLFEAPFGLTLRQIIDDFGGGMLEDSDFHFALAGGAAGRLVPEKLLDVPIDYKSAAKGVPLGVGAFLVCDQTVSPIALLREVFHFFESESCGKCTPCRVGTRRVRQILDGILAGESKEGDIKELRELAHILGKASFCGLGTSAAWPLESALDHFEQDFAKAVGS